VELKKTISVGLSLGVCPADTVGRADSKRVLLFRYQLVSDGKGRLYSKTVHAKGLKRRQEDRMAQSVEMYL
jgi:hypothetical protein